MQYASWQLFYFFRRSFELYDKRYEGSNSAEFRYYSSEHFLSFDNEVQYAKLILLLPSSNSHWESPTGS